MTFNFSVCKVGDDSYRVSGSTGQGNSRNTTQNLLTVASTQEIHLRSILRLSAKPMDFLQFNAVFITIQMRV
jgi:hypothetical protein